MTSEWPPNLVDHIDNNPQNNRWSNLRLATSSQNNINRKHRKAGSLKGAVWCPWCSLWRARIYYGGVPIQIGYFKTREEAHAAYVKRAKEIYGEFARAG